MSNIRATCPTCGEVVFTEHDITVRLNADNNRRSYWFACPQCGAAVTKDKVSQRIANMLISAGAQLWIEVPLTKERKKRKSLFAGTKELKPRFTGVIHASGDEFKLDIVKHDGGAWSVELLELVPAK